MAKKKYITADLFKKYKKIFPELEKKATYETLWNLVADKTGIDASLEVNKTTAQLKFDYQDKVHKLTRKASEIRLEVNDDVKEENYELLIKYGLEYIIANKLIKPDRKKKEKN